MSYNVLGPVHNISAGDMSASITGKPVWIKNQDNVGIQFHWTGTPSGSFDVQVSIDHFEDPVGNVITAGQWVSLTLDPVIVASGAPDDAYVELNQLSAFWIRVVYSRSSGSGALDVYFTAKGV